VRRRDIHIILIDAAKPIIYNIVRANLWRDLWGRRDDPEQWFSTFS